PSVSPCSPCSDRATRNLPSFPTRRSSDLFQFQEAVTILLEYESLEQISGLEVGVRILSQGGAIVFTSERSNSDTSVLPLGRHELDRKSTCLNSSHVKTSYAVFCLTKIILG